MIALQAQSNSTNEAVAIFFGRDDFIVKSQQIGIQSVPVNIRSVIK